MGLGLSNFSPEWILIFKVQAQNFRTFGLEASLSIDTEFLKIHKTDLLHKILAEFTQEIIDTTILNSIVYNTTHQHNGLNI